MMKKQKIKMLLGGLAVFVAVFAATTFIKASTANNTTGWLWGGTTNVGWVSMNNTNRNWDVSYGLSIPETDGNLSGYGWSENVGAIAFDNSAGYLTGCPSGTCSARRVGDKLQGWARFVEIKKALNIGNSGGWQGWIKLDPTKGGVSIDTASGYLKGYAWSDELGWIDFSKAKIGAAAPTCSPSYSYSCVSGTVPDDVCDGNAGKTVPAGTVNCVKKSVCPNGTEIVSKTECASQGIACSSPTINCPAVVTSPNYNNFREVAP